jgi:DNA-binding PadR family transcriptional regulator
MFHPLEGDLSRLKDSEVESKLQELTRKYYQASRLGSQELLTQLSTFVTIYRDELRMRQAKALSNNNVTNEDLGQFINVD